MMRSSNYPDEYSPIGGMTHVEAEAGWTLRHCTVCGEYMLASTITYPHWRRM